MDDVVDEGVILVDNVQPEGNNMYLKWNQISFNLNLSKLFSMITDGDNSAHKNVTDEAQSDTLDENISDDEEPKIPKNALSHKQSKSRVLFFQIITRIHYNWQICDKFLTFTYFLWKSCLLLQCVKMYGNTKSSRNLENPTVSLNKIFTWA